MPEESLASLTVSDAGKALVK